MLRADKPEIDPDVTGILKESNTKSLHKDERPHLSQRLKHFMSQPQLENTDVSTSMLSQYIYMNLSNARTQPFYKCLGFDFGACHPVSFPTLSIPPSLEVIMEKAEEEGRHLGITENCITQPKIKNVCKGNSNIHNSLGAEKVKT